jgi:hypothetical protein
MAMLVDIVRSAFCSRYVIVREFWNVPLVIMLPFLFIWRKRILWNVNHNLRSGSSGTCPVALSLAARLGFRFLLLDGSAAVAGLPHHVRYAFSTPLFPITDRLRSRRAKRDVAHVSLVGDMRPEKVATGELERVVQQLSDLSRVHVQIGVRNGQLPEVRVQQNVTFADTSTRLQFLGLLGDSDIVVVLARRDAYYLRNSGTVLDAISCGAWPVVPAYPVLEVQVSHPVRVGSTYGPTSEIVAVVREAIASLESLESSRAAYFSGRGPVNLVVRES